ncbi:hypothetical protein ACRAWD_16175 [Caulobacter segnis]
MQDLAAALVAEGVNQDRAIQLGLVANEKLEAAPDQLRVTLRFRSGQAGVVDTVELRRGDGSGLMLRGGGASAVQAASLAADRIVEVKVVRGRWTPTASIRRPWRPGCAIPDRRLRRRLRVRLRLPARDPPR